MGRKKSFSVSSGEMALLKMLWAEGQVTLAQANEVFSRYGSKASYPTIQTRLNRLVGKGLAVRSDERPARYSAAVSESQIVQRRAREILKGLGREKLIPLVAHLISETPLTGEEVAELKELVEAMEQKARKNAKKRASPKRKN